MVTMPSRWSMSSLNCVQKVAQDCSFYNCMILYNLINHLNIILTQSLFMNILTNARTTQWHVSFGKPLLITCFSLKVGQNFSYVLILKQIIQIIFHLLSAYFNEDENFNFQWSEHFDFLERIHSFFQSTFKDNFLQSYTAHARKLRIIEDCFSFQYSSKLLTSTLIIE